MTDERRRVTLCDCHRRVCGSHCTSTWRPTFNSLIAFKWVCFSHCQRRIARIDQDIARPGGTDGISKAIAGFSLRWDHVIVGRDERRPSGRARVRRSASNEDVGYRADLSLIRDVDILAATIAGVVRPSTIVLNAGIIHGARGNQPGLGGCSRPISLSRFELTRALLPLVKAAGRGMIRRIYSS